MAAPNEKLAASLAHLERLQKQGRRVFRSAEFSRTHRERLVGNGFLFEAIKGWLIASGPETDPGDTTQWYASFWEFCASYCAARFGEAWHLSPEQSLLLHAENTVIPRQVVIHAPKGGNNTIRLPFGMSLFDLGRQDAPPDTDITTRNRLRLFLPEAALIRVPATFFARHPVEAQVAILGIRDPHDVLNRLLRGGHAAAAGRLAGALRRLGRAAAADEVRSVMRRAGYDIRETNPFAQAPPSAIRGRSPIVSRVETLWQTFRPDVIKVFPEAPGLPPDPDAWPSSVDDLYRHDAWHSLSIEGYRVTPALIERVRSGDWDPQRNQSDRQSLDALAARGYWLAFQLVREAVGEALAGAAPGHLVRKAHQDWFRALFQPRVAAGLTPAASLAGYRDQAVFLRGSRHAPPRREAVRDAMPALFDLLEGEPEASVRAVLGHWLFGYIHPYPDGNGRLARFLMNVMLASGGYPWTIIRLESRDDYLEALERASVFQDIEPFARFVADRVRATMKTT